MHLSFENWLQMITTGIALLAFLISINSARRRDIDKRLGSIE